MEETLRSLYSRWIIILMNLWYIFIAYENIWLIFLYLFAQCEAVRWCNWTEHQEVPTSQSDYRSEKTILDPGGGVLGRTKQQDWGKEFLGLHHCFLILLFYSAATCFNWRELLGTLAQHCCQQVIESSQDLGADWELTGSDKIPC